VGHFLHMRWQGGLRRDFQRKASVSIDDWLEVAADLVSNLGILAQAEWAETAGTEKVRRLRAKLPWLKGNLEKLGDYFRETRKDAEGFIRDPEVLSAALEALAQHEETVRALISALEQVH